MFSGLNGIDTSLRRSNELSVENVGQDIASRQPSEAVPWLNDLFAANQALTAEKCKTKMLQDELEGLRELVTNQAFEKDSAIKESELISQHLQKVQEELESYFLISKEQSRLLGSSFEEQRKTLSLLVEMNK